MTDVRSLEHHTLKVPYEILNKKFRGAQKTLDREVSYVQSAAQELEKGLQPNREGFLQNKASDISQLLGGMAERLNVFKRKAEESLQEELQAGYLCKRRLEHLKEGVNAADGPEAAQWRRTRLDRMLVEYFLRQGYYNSAASLARSSEIGDLTNIDVFLYLREVEKSLEQHDTSKCLAWCHDNKSKLRKLKSTMEFNLRIQEFVELVREDRRLDAVRHARRHLSGCEKEQMAVVQNAMALLALPHTTVLSPYRQLLSPDRWFQLIQQFRQENYKLFQLPTQSTFTVTLQAGLSALKTSQCYSDMKEHRNPSCPVCEENLNQLAEPLPYAHCSQSRLVCSITGKPLNEHNIPLMLPNGHVYGEIALSQMAAENNGSVICPKTRQCFPFKKLEKVYVM